MVERVRLAPVIHIASGYVLTSDAELAAYDKIGALPAIAIEMERARQQVLWKWYCHVVDVMMDRECLNAALYELRTTRLVASGAATEPLPDHLDALTRRYFALCPPQVKA